jgi:NAD(P) transhydrogenase subunit alpha
MSQTPQEPTREPAPAPTRVSVAVIRESAPGERRVALVPESVAPLVKAGFDVMVESGAGAAAWLDDDAYTRAGATIVTGSEVMSRADVVVMVGTVAPERRTELRPGQVVIGMLKPLVDLELAEQLARAGVTAISLDGLPRTLSRAQAMDALTSQSNVAGYKAVLMAADTFGRFFPLLITAAGTSKPAAVLVIGAGVAGLSAMGTARRLGAVVTGYDVRPDARADIESVGARSLKLDSVGQAVGEGGYARALTDQERQAQQEELNGHLAHFDVVITTAQVPGRRPPLLITADALKRLRPGAVVVDLGASPLGGNVEGSIPDRTFVTEGSVTIIGAGNLPSQVPTAASVAYSHNMTALLLFLFSGGGLVLDPTDEIQAGVVITHGGKVLHPAGQPVRQPLDQPVAMAGGAR